MTSQAGLLTSKINYFVNTYCRKTRLDRSLVEDFVMDAYLRLYESRPEEINLQAWLHKTIKNIITDYYRRNKYDLYMFDYSSNDEHVDYELVAEAVDNLKPIYHTVIKLHYYESFSYSEIAEILDIPINTVKTHIHQAKKELKTKLDVFYS